MDSVFICEVIFWSHFSGLGNIEGHNYFTWWYIYYDWDLFCVLSLGNFKDFWPSCCVLSRHVPFFPQCLLSIEKRALWFFTCVYLILFHEKFSHSWHIFSKQLIFVICSANPCLTQSEIIHYTQGIMCGLQEIWIQTSHFFWSQCCNLSFSLSCQDL